MHKDDPNTANPSPLEAVPAADFDLVQPPYLVCDARGFLSPWTVCYLALEQQYFNLIASFLPRENIPTQLSVAQCTPSGKDREQSLGFVLGNCHIFFFFGTSFTGILECWWLLVSTWCYKFPSLTSVCLTGAVPAVEDGPAQGWVWWIRQKNQVLPHQVEGA